MTVAITNFIEVDLDSLLPETILGVDIYIARDSRYVLYRKGDQPFGEEHRRELMEHGHQKVYLSAADRYRFQLYIESTIGEVLRSPHIPVQKKSKIVYDVTAYLMKDVFGDPRDGDRIKRSKRLVRHTVDLMRSGEEAARQLMRLTAHDYRTYTHSVNTTIYAVRLAERVLSEKDGHNFYELGYGFLLHDLGKSRIDSEILNKPGPLDEHEWTLMKKHPEYGCELLESAGELSAAVKHIVLEHHERYQGGGYPTGRQGEEIHPYGRICCISDTFDALTTRRTYRPALSTFDALRVMQQEMPGHFDPHFYEETVLMFKE